MTGAEAVALVKRLRMTPDRPARFELDGQPVSVEWAGWLLDRALAGLHPGSYRIWDDPEPPRQASGPQQSGERPGQGGPGWDQGPARRAG